MTLSCLHLLCELLSEAEEIYYFGKKGREEYTTMIVLAVRALVRACI